MNDTIKSQVLDSQAKTDAHALALLKAYKIEYTRADEFVGIVQNFIDEAGIPAINELRYAGYHLNLALDESGNLDPVELQRAINHCKRACYEAGEAGIITALQFIKQFKDDYRKIVISSVVKNWIEILEDCDKANESLAYSRQNGEDRSIDHSTYLSHFNILAAHCKRLNIYREELNKQIISDRRDTQRTIIIGAGGIIATLLTLLL